MANRSVESARSICPYCGVGCGLTYAESAAGATGWPGPVNTRGEICPKGAAAWEVVEHDDRLRRPLLREHGHLVTGPWEAAFDRIEKAIRRTIEAHGPNAVGFFASSNCTNEENYILQKIARALGTNNIDNCARLCHASTVAAMGERLGAGAMTNSLDDLRRADAILVTGANPAEQHPVIFRSYLLPEIQDGTTLIHVDPRENDTTRAADIHLPVRPGHDIPLLNAMAKVILEAGLVDESFVADRVDGLEAFERHLDEIDVDAHASLAGVELETLREAARAYGAADRAASITGMGMSQHRCGTDNVHALINLALLTGNIGREGTGVNPLRGQNNVQGAGDVGALPSVLPGYRPVTDAAAREDVATVWGFEPPADPGLTEVEMTHAFGDEIRAAIVLGENPVVTEPNANRIRRQFDGLDFLAVIDLFETETAEFADVVLPGSSWAEKRGTVTNTDRQVQLLRPMTDPPGSARRDLDILTTIGRRVTDRPDAFAFQTAEAVFEELLAALPQYGGMTYDAIGETGLRWPFPTGAESGTAVLHRDRFENGNVRASLRRVSHVEPADALEAGKLRLTTGRVLQHFNSGALTRRSGTLVRMREEDVLQIHPDDAADRGIADGELVRVWNDRGSVTLDAEVTPAIRPGAVFCTFHYADTLINQLTDDALDPVAKIPEYKHSAVRVEPAK